MNPEQVKKDIMFLLSFVPAKSPSEVVPGLCPTFYITTNYEGDLRLVEEISNICSRYGIDTSEEIDEL